MFTLEADGLHPSTVDCLHLLSWLGERVRCTNVLEIGCGNGILSLVSAHMWNARVVAADISDKAVRDTAEQAALYGLSNQIQTVRSDGFSHPIIGNQAPYDLIICNLLVELQSDIAKKVALTSCADGYVLLGGILEWKKQEIENIYNNLGFLKQNARTTSPWNTMLFCHATVT